MNYAKIDKIIVTELSAQIERFKEDLKKDKPLVFCKDPKRDRKKIKCHIKAFEKVIKYFE